MEGKPSFRATGVLSLTNLSFVMFSCQNNHIGNKQAIKKQRLCKEKLYFIRVVFLSYMLHLNSFKDIFHISKQSKHLDLLTLVNK